MLNFPKIPKIALRKFSELSTSLWRSKGDFRVKLTFFWVALHVWMCGATSLRYWRSPVIPGVSLILRTLVGCGRTVFGPLFGQQNASV